MPEEGQGPGQCRGPGLGRDHDRLLPPTVRLMLSVPPGSMWVADHRMTAPVDLAGQAVRRDGC
jgi:hypothetical protein